MKLSDVILPNNAREKTQILLKSRKDQLIKLALQN